MKYLLGLDLGSSSVKGALIDADSGVCLANTHQPKEEMSMLAHQPGWAEQDPESWWKYVCQVIQELIHTAEADASEIGAIGISYQMHGLVLVDKNQAVLRPSIIWCDSRAVSIGQAAFDTLGHDRCLSCLLNSPGNFTASKLRWVKENEPALFEQIDRLMLPGDYIAMKLSGESLTTYSGLSEGIFWDFQENQVAQFLLDHYEIPSSFIPPIHPSFGAQGTVSPEAAALTGLVAGIPITYRAGDQPNNALSLNVLEPGEIAATAGTSGVVYGVSDQVTYDPASRVNTFAHVNHRPDHTRLGVLLCVNGTGILNSWLRKNVVQGSYDEMNQKAAAVGIGSEGLVVLPFGNGAERVLENRNLGARIEGLNFNVHQEGHLIRAGHEGIAFALNYGMDIMQQMGITPSVIRAGEGNMFLSPIFRDTFVNTLGVPVELYNTDGAQGAARGAGMGVGHYASAKEAFAGLEKVATIEPNPQQQGQYADAFGQWKGVLAQALE